MANARPSVTKKLREQVKRERQRLKQERRAQRKLEHQAGHAPADPADEPIIVE